MAAETPQVKDEQLAAEAQDGSLDAFSELVDRYQSHIFHFLCHKTASTEDAQDVAQQVFITAWQRIHQFRVDAKFATWLFTIARRLTINYYRARGSRTFVELEEAKNLLVTTDTPASDLATRDEHAELWATARANLSESQFTALWLKYREHMSIKEMAKAMDKKQVTIKVLLHRARKALGAALGGRRGATDNLNPAHETLPRPKINHEMTLQPGVA